MPHNDEVWPRWFAGIKKRPVGRLLFNNLDIPTRKFYGGIMAIAPVVTITTSCSQEELLEYLQQKVSANRHLKAAIAERQSLLLQIEEVEARIEGLTSSAALELTGKAQDPTRHL